MISANELRARLTYYPTIGSFQWVDPSPYHSEKLGLEAGGPVPGGSGKLYHTISVNGRKYKRSRLAWLYMTGEWPEHQIDHINGNSLDDRWCNLRQATATENAWNHKRRAKKSDLPMGVRTIGPRFQARLAVNHKMIHLGCFATPEEASDAYRQAREKHYGEFA